jgi:hypothetical protein
MCRYDRQAGLREDHKIAVKWAGRNTAAFPNKVTIDQNSTKFINRKTKN